MIRKVEGARGGFVLHTRRTTYCMRVTPAGLMEHLYYGERLPHVTGDDLEAMAQKRAFEPGNSIVSARGEELEVQEDMRLELSAEGKGDIREPFVTVCHSDGSRTSDFRYVSARISDKKEPFGTLPGSYTEDGKAEHLILTFRDAQYDLELELHYYVYADCDCICRSSLLRNRSSEKVTVERLMSTQLDLDGCGYVLTSFGGAWAREMERKDLILEAGRAVVESFTGTSSNRANPFVMLSTPGTDERKGTCIGLNLIYSGNHYETAQVNAYGSTRVLTGINPRGFSWCLEPGECFEAPETVMTWSGEGFTGMSLQMHRFVREHIVRGEWKKKERPVLINSWEASYFRITQNSLLRLARAAAGVGIELFVMDDGWFGERNDETSSLGDWRENRKKLPEGLAGICRRVNELGMQFGIWVEPEMVNENSDLYRAHPDWVMQIPGKPHAEGRTQRILDLANPEVVAYMTAEMARVFSSANITYVKWDMNRIFSDVYSPCLPAERQGETAHRYVCGLYRMMQSLTEQFPHILFEGCASGGNRFDLGILSYFPQIWASDNTDAICRAKIQEGYSYGYPMSTVSAHVSASPNHQTLRRTPLDTRFNVAVFGVLGYECNLPDLLPVQRREIARQVSFYKKWRKVLQYGNFYRGRSGNLHEWTCVSPGKGKAAGMLLQELVRPNTQTEKYYAAGLDPAARYHFTREAKALDLLLFGDLVNTQSPIHVKQGSTLHKVIAKIKSMPGESEDLHVSGAVLMRAGVHLKQAFGGTGYNDQVRYFQDFSSRLYLMEKEE